MIICLLVTKFLVLPLLPTKPNTYVKNEKVKIIWLGPDEWLIINDQENELFIKLKNELGNS